MTASHKPFFQTRRALSAAALFVAAVCAATPASQAAEPAVASAPSAVATKDPCSGVPRCYNAGTFIAEVTQVTGTAMTGGARHQVVSINIRFRNVTDKPAILAYKSASSAATDNFGNAFTWGRPGSHDTSVKGIGMVAGRSVDTQFSLAPGQSRNATFGIIRFNAAPPIGDAWNYDVVIEEIEVLPGQVVRSARQNSVSFQHLRAGTFPSVASAGGAPTGDAVDVANKVMDLFDRMKKK
jgi:hypothetical protein